MKIPFSAIGVGIVFLGISLFQVAFGYPPYPFFLAFLIAALCVVLSAMGGFEWGLGCMFLQVCVAWFFRDAFISGLMLFFVAWAWYISVTLLAVHGSRVLMGIASGMLFVGLLIERIPTFTFQQWILFFALFLLEVSGMYLAGNVLRGRWFSPYA